MSFATKGMKMTRGSRGATENPVVSTKARDFSNASVIDYRPGINFSNMLANSQAEFPVASKEYNVNLDAQGHTVNMQIQPLMNSHNIAQDSKQVFLSSDQIADVASRIASEMCGKTLAETQPTVRAEAMPPHLIRQLDDMQRRIDSLQGELKFKDQPAHAITNPVYTNTMQSVPIESHIAQNIDSDKLQSGLRHHADVLRAAQQKISSLEHDMSHVMKISGQQSDTLKQMDVGLRNQRTEIENSNQHMRGHVERVQSHDQQIMHLASQAELRMSDHATFESRCKASIASLRSESDNNIAVSASLQDRVLKMNAGLQNHQEAIRGMRRNYDDTMSSNMATDQRIKEMSVGLQEQSHALRNMRSDYMTNNSVSLASEQRMQQISAGLDNHRAEIRMLKAAGSHIANYEGKAEIMTHLERMSSDLMAHKQEVNSLKSKMNSSQQTSARDNSVIAHLESLDAGLEQHQSEIRSLKSAMGKTVSLAAIDAIDAGLQNHKSEIRSMRSALSNNVQEMGALRVSAQPVTAQLNAMQTRLDAMQNSLMTSRNAEISALLPQQERTATTVTRNDLSSFLQRRPNR